MSSTRAAITNNEPVFQALRVKPLVAWPTVLLMLACHAAIAFSWYGVLTDRLPLWAACVINCIAFYGLFTPSHDGMHRSLSRVGWLNELLLFITVQPAVPLSTGHALRVMHMQHHKHLNDPVMDPDHAHGHSLKGALWGWFWWDIAYVQYYRQHKDDIHPSNYRRIAWDLWAPYVPILALAWFFPLEMLLLWFIPARFMAWMICATFMYLPHWPHEVSDKQDAYQATTVRKGAEWLLSPLLVYQNYHLVHHLYPTIPFYRYRKAWLARLDRHLAGKPAVVAPLGLARMEQAPPAADW